MTNEEAIKWLKTFKGNTGMTELSQAFDVAIKSLEQEPCEDCISRQAVLDIAKSSKSNWIDNSVLFKRVNELPLVIPQPKAGHWIELGYLENDNYDFECSVCHHTDTHSKTVKVNYCWYCGAKMECEVEE